MKTILVHINVEVPEDSDATADSVARYIDDALTVGLEGRPAGILTDSTITVAHAEEI